MGDKILKMIEPDILNRTFNNGGKNEPFEKYLKDEVFPYIDLSSSTIILKNGIVVSLKDFIEQSVLYTCQNRYNGNFVEFAKDNLISFDEAKAKLKAKQDAKRFSNINKDFKFSPLAQSFTFFETIDAPKYNVVIDHGKIFFYYKDDNFDVVMQNENDKKDFLKRIKKIDLPFFIKLYENNPIFKETIAKYKESDMKFYETIITGVEKRSAFDREIDNQIGAITDMINEVEGSSLYKTAETNLRGKSQGFDIKDIPRFDVDTCLKTIISKCSSYYSEFSSDIAESMQSNSVIEKAEYVTDEFLLKTIDGLFFKYVSGVAESVNNDLALDINEEFLSSELGKVMAVLRDNLKRLFVYPYRNKESDSKDVYIKIICDSIENQIICYEQLVNSTIEDMLVKCGYELRITDDTTMLPKGLH